MDIQVRVFFPALNMRRILPTVDSPFHRQYTDIWNCIHPVLIVQGSSVRARAILCGEATLHGLVIGPSR